MKTQSLRFQLSLWYAVLFTAIFSCFGLFIWVLINHLLEKNLGETLSRRAHQVAESFLPSFDARRMASLAEEIKARFAPESGGRFIRVAESDGRGFKTIYLSGRPNDGSFDPADVAAVPIPDQEYARVQTLPNKNQLMIVALPFSAGGPRFLVEVGGSLSPIKTVLSQVSLAMAIGGPLVIALAVFGAFILVGRALAPVAKLTQGAERITLRNLNESLPVSSTGDELENLSLALNKMIFRIRESFEYTRRFIADASHELRTPLTVMRTELETLLPQGAVSRSPELQDSLASILEEIDRLAIIVEGLLALSLLDAGTAQTEAVPLDLGVLASSVAEQMGLVAEDKSIRLRAECASPVPVTGDRSRLKQVLVNLLDNAIKYTLPGGEITLRTRISGDKAILEVIDTGIGIPEKDLPHVFERFFRVDKARSREVGGAGLGLSIVKSICSAHHGSVEAESLEGQGSSFRIVLPLHRNAHLKSARAAESTFH